MVYYYHVEYRAGLKALAASTGSFESQGSGRWPEKPLTT